MKIIVRIFGILTFLIVFSGISVRAEDSKNVFKDIKLGFANLDIGGGLRLRSQLQNNFNIKKYIQGRDGFVEERIRLDFNLKFIENMRLYVQLQDAHVGDLNFTVKDFYPPYSPYENQLDLRQFCYEYQNIVNTPLGVKFGRQTFLYGDNRILGPGEWGNVGRYYWDAMKFLYTATNCKTDVFVARQVMSDPHGFDTNNPDVNVYGLYSVFKFFNPNIDVFYILKENNKCKFKSSSLGTRLDGNISMLFYSGTFAYQFGDTGAKNISAYGYNAKLGYCVPKLWLSEFGVEYSYASGDDNHSDGTHKTFDGVLGAIDLYYGRMAMFSWMNLKDFQINLDSKPTRKLSTTIQYHRFKLAESKDAWYYGNGKPQRKDMTGASGSTLGQEAMVTIKYIFNRHFDAYAGFCYFFPGEFIKNTAGSKEESSLGFLQVEFKF